MKNFLIVIIDRSIELLLRIQKRLINKQVESNYYHPLSPTNEAENVDVYIESLQYALNNRGRIRNVAVSGPYGSGKSSVIQTFIEKNKHNTDLKFLNLSLATFKEKNGKGEVGKEGDEGENDGSSGILRLIELSVLQQLFYHEKDDKIPDSRFKKIRTSKSSVLFAYALGFVSFSSSLLYLITPDFLSKLSIVEIPSDWNNLLHLGAAAWVWACVLFVAYKLSRIVKGVTITKLNLNNAEIEIDKKISKSILNHHLDEILYFFEATRYNVVIIEDLDRFDQTDIFTKLREINLLINKSRKIGDVVFIYAIRDEMFKDKDRAKFFDFMVPIIPIINSSNSNEKLLKLVEDNKYPISKHLLEDMSFFIDDMRLLYNVMNEYRIYSQRLEQSLNQDKLFAILVYKNLYPCDFTKLDQNAGTLYNAISKKSVLIVNEEREIEKEIERVEALISQLEIIRLKDIKELRMVYVGKAVAMINANGYYFKNFIANHGVVSIERLVEDEEFQLLRDGQMNFTIDGYNPKRLPFRFTELEKAVDTENSYDVREALVIEAAKIDDLKRLVEVFKKKELEVRKWRLCDIIKNGKIDLEITDAKQSDLINLLLRKGYVDENYIDYVSVFHEGSLTRADYQFLLNLKIQKQSGFDYKVVKVDNLIEKIDLFDFDHEFVLNYSVVDKLLEDSRFKDKRVRLLKQLSNESALSIDFIDQYIDVSMDLKSFVAHLSDYWIGIWDFVANRSMYSEEKKEKYFKLILNYAKVESLTKVFKSSVVYLNQREDLLLVIKDVEKAKRIIKNLNLKCRKLDERSPKNLVDFVLEGEYYEINQVMLRFLLKHIGQFNSETFECQNYTAILNSKYNPLIAYVDANVEEYLNVVYLQLANNVLEPHDVYLLLLNNEAVALDVKIELIKHVNTKINSLELVEDREVWDELLRYSKIDVSWANVMSRFTEKDNELDEVLIFFLNELSNAETLSSNLALFDESDEEEYMPFFIKIIHEPSINLESYDLLLRSLPWCINDIEFDRLSKDRVVLLIRNYIISPSLENYSQLKEHFDGLNVMYLEYFANDLNVDLASLSIDSKDLELILKSSKLTDTQKNSLLKVCPNSVIISKPSILLELHKLMKANVGFVVDDIIIKEMLLSQLIEVDARISLFNKRSVVVDEDFVFRFLESLGGNYVEISDMNRKALIPDTIDNRLFLDKLKMLGYISSYSDIDKGLRINHRRLG